MQVSNAGEGPKGASLMRKLQKLPPVKLHTRYSKDFGDPEAVRSNLADTRRRAVLGIDLDVGKFPANTLNSLKPNYNEHQKLPTLFPVDLGS
jgi:hypothetical protein